MSKDSVAIHVNWVSSQGLNKFFEYTSQFETGHLHFDPVFQSKTDHQETLYADNTK